MEGFEGLLPSAFLSFSSVAIGHKAIDIYFEITNIDREKSNTLVRFRVLAM